MSSLFADTHNVVAILEKSDAAEGFEQIIDFLSGTYIHYALTVNPHIYILCIKQFWNTASIKRSGDVTRLQALVDKKKIVISEVVIHEILQLDDAEGIVCFPNEEIFAGLAQMGYKKPSTKLTFYKAFFSSQWKFLIYTILQSLSAKRTSWNEFSMAMASAVICLSKVGDLSTYTTRFISPALTQKVFANMRMVGKGFLWVETPLFEGMLTDRQHAEEELVDEHVQVDDAVAAAVEENVVEDVSHDAIPSPPSHAIPSPSQAQTTPPQQPYISPLKLEIVKLKAKVKKLEKTNKVKSSNFRRLRKVGASRRVKSFDEMEEVFNQGRMMNEDEGIDLVKDADIADTEGRQVEKQAEIYNLDLDHSTKVLSMQEDDSEVQEVIEVVTTAKLITNVVTAAASQVSVASATIPAAKPSIPAAAPTVVAAYTRRRKGMIIRDPKEELSLKTPAETPKVKDNGKGIMVESPKPMKKKDQIELDVEYVRKLHEEINKDDAEINKDIDWDAAMDHNTAGYKMDFFKGMSYADICLICQARFDENMRFLFNSREEIEEEDQEIIKSINETPVQKAAKRRKMNEEAQEAEELKKQLEIVNDEDDDVFTKATPLGRKRYPLSKFTLEQLVNVERLQVEEESEMSLELLRSKKNTKYVNVADEELTVAKHKLMLDMTKESGDTSKKQEDETIDTFIRKLTTLVNKAASLGHKIKDQTLVRKLLNVVPDRYLQIVASIEQYSDLSEMTMEEAIGRLKTYEKRIKYKKGKQVDNQEELMFTRHKSKGKYFRGRGRGKHRFSQGKSHKKFKEERKDRESSYRNFNRNNFKKSSYDTSKLQCDQYSDEGKQVKEVKEQKVLLHEEDVGYKEINMDSQWYLENGASNHMTRVREHFKELDQKVSGKVVSHKSSSFCVGILQTLFVVPQQTLPNKSPPTCFYHKAL
nr:zinc finger, CCHC-type [Tanacetum cinerariifolium]